MIFIIRNLNTILIISRSFSLKKLSDIKLKELIEKNSLVMKNQISKRNFDIGNIFNWPKMKKLKGPENQVRQNS